MTWPMVAERSDTRDPSGGRVKRLLSSAKTCLKDHTVTRSLSVGFKECFSAQNNGLSEGEPQEFVTINGNLILSCDECQESLHLQ